MKKRMVALMLSAVVAVGMLAGCGEKKAEEQAVEELSSEIDAAVDEAVAEEVVEEAVEEEVSEISYVDGFYANDGSSDFIIAFYENAPGDVCYINDGTNEVLAEYVVEEAALDDGTAYYLVTVGGTQLGYIDDGDNVAIIDTDGNLYAAAHLSEEEADSIYQALQ